MRRYVVVSLTRHTRLFLDIRYLCISSLLRARPPAFPREPSALLYRERPGPLGSYPHWQGPPVLRLSKYLHLNRRRNKHS